MLDMTKYSMFHLLDATHLRNKSYVSARTSFMLERDFILIIG